MERSDFLYRLRSPWVRWGVAVVGVLLATACNLGYQRLVHGASFFTPYYPAVAAIALLGGRAPAFVSMLASALIVATLWMDPVGYPFALPAPQQWALVGFIFSASIMGFIALKMRDYAERLAGQTEVIERQRAELQTMLDLIPVGIGISHDPEGDQITFTPNFQKVMRLGKQQNASLSGPGHETIPFRAMRDGREIDPKELPMQVASRTGQEVRDVDLDLVFADGQTLEMRVSAAPLFDEDGKVRGAIGAHVDLTSLRQASRALAEASRQKDEFLATLAHELRSPLAPIRYAAAALKRDQSQDSVERCRAMIERQAAHMTRLLDDLLDLSRITRNAISLKRETIDLQLIAQEALDAMQAEFDKRGQRVVVSFPAEPAWIVGDRERLHQVIDNLLSNAAKYTEPCGQVTLAVALEDDEAVVQVIDDGIGIAPEMIPRIFDLFTQAHPKKANAASNPGSGLGIGLAVVQRLVKMHGGNVDVSSDGIGKGVQFTVRLPRTSAPLPARSTDFSNVMPLFNATPRVLVVDDSRDAADSLAEYLRLHELAVTVAYDGPEATDYAERLRPDVIILDIGMPHVDGVAVAAWIRSKPWGTGVRLIALTGWGQPADRARTKTAGFDVHLVKPVDPEHLLSHLKAMFGTDLSVGA